MRWFIEISTVGGGADGSKYCVEAKQWQTALQQARKLQGDSGPLSAFSIELLDNGYRATDRKQRLRYMVKKAPGDAPLTELDPVTKLNGSGTAAHVGVTPVSESARPTAPPKPKLESTRPASPGPSPGAQGPKNILDGAGSLTQKSPLGGAKKGPDGLSDPHKVKGKNKNRGKDDPLKLNGPASSAESKTAASTRESTKPPPKLELVAEPSANFSKSTQAAPAPQSPPAPQANPAAPKYDLIEERSEEPSEESPIIYREQALAVSPGTPRSAVEALLRLQHARLSENLAGRSQRKFIQLAVFDHVFSDRPLRAPLGVLMFKDWRGDPVLSFPGLPDEPATTPPPTPPSEEPPRESLRPISVVPIGPAEGAASASAAPAAASAEPAEASVERAPESTPPPSHPTPPGGIALDLKVQKAPSQRPAQPAAKAPSTPPPSSERQRDSKQDLISDLFESMHELHFARDLYAGADFVETTLKATLHTRIGLVHVFDINTSEFVIVRAWGLAPESLLVRTPDRDELLDKVMRRPRATRFEDAETNPAFGEGRWKLCQTAPHSVILAPVHIGGRYLGLLEVAHDAGEAPFFESEVNALEYIAEQFAEFLSNRPIVLDREVILKGR